MVKTFVGSAILAAASFAVTQPASAVTRLNGMRLNGQLWNGQVWNGQKMQGMRLNGVQRNYIAEQGRSVQGTATGATIFAIDGIELPASVR